MNVQDYKNAGFAVSAQIEQPVIDRAEQDVQAAYLAPICSRTEQNAASYDAAKMNLVFLAILQRSIHATRAGAKEKTSAQSVTADRQAQIVQQSGVCQFHLSSLAKMEGVDKPWRMVRDICNIYWKSFYKGI